jgi:uncharacterized protein
MSAFSDRYGPWAVIAGGSQGIGAAFAREVSALGVCPILVARRAEPLAELAGTLASPAIAVAADLSTVDGLAAVADAAAGRPVGLVVANAALAPIGDFLDLDPARAGRVVDLNCRAPLWLAQHFLPDMVARGRGGFIVMSSMAGLQGSPRITVYAATKAFGAVFAEGLWAELRGTGVDVLACVAGAVRTPGLVQSKPKPAPGTITPQRVAVAALRRLGHGPRTVPGGLMKFSSVLTTRLLPRRSAIALISRASRDLTTPG